MLSGELYVKYGRRVHLSEASTMRFVLQHTSIPVPKVLCAFTRSGRTYIVMERIKGDIISNGWDLQPLEGMGVALVDGGSLFDCCVPGRSLHFGPFATTQDFHYKTWPLVFTHGDLSSLNILVCGDDIVVNPQNSFWPMPEELAMEQIRQKHFRDI
ncbi:hypothetical protein V8F44DRAFT_629787 [Aspergillus fumigatus]